ncbi:MAG: class I SAM-dependent methyltransferase [Bacteroidetes bacterium]|nr:MAG: class I SAM-dependent methyltransferase [Bacteroidota bacterium]
MIAVTEQFEEISFKRNRFFNIGLAGQDQRLAVHRYLEKSQLNSGSVLELNCGMGEDLAWFARHGHTVDATDISHKMVHFCRQRVLIEETPGIKVHVAGFHEVHELFPSKKFNCVFSNFAGLNCVDSVEISMLGKRLTHMLSDDGDVILVVKGRFCLMESFCLFISGRWDSIFRRLSKKPGPESVKVLSHPIWFYTPREIKRLFGSQYKVKKLQGIGVFIPPACMNERYEKRAWYRNFAKTAERLIGPLFWSAYISDHFLIHLSKKSVKPSV